MADSVYIFKSLHSKVHYEQLCMPSVRAAKYQNETCIITTHFSSIGSAESSVILVLKEMKTKKWKKTWATHP